jgi:DNA-binding FadR family transcriptional regulator
VREAIKTLSAKGMVAVAPKLGRSVAPAWASAHHMMQIHFRHQFVLEYFPSLHYESALCSIHFGR